jgi:hypothetical protein
MPPDPNDRDALAVYDGLLEAALGHARATVELLVGRGPNHKRNPRDIGPQDLGLAMNWLPAPAIAARLQRWLETIDAHLAHLSKKRMLTRPRWDLVALVKDIADGIDALVGATQSPSAQLTQARDEARASVNQLGGNDRLPRPTLSVPASTTTPDPVIYIQRGHR